MSSIPACVTRDNLTSPYWPNTSRGTLTSIVVLGLVFMFTGFNRLNHTDLWTHVNFGRWIAISHALPFVDPLAAEPSAIPVLHSAWLAQLLAYETHAHFGNEGLALAHAAIVTLTAAVLMLAIYRRGTSGVFAATAGLAFLLLDLPIVGTIRPQLFGQLGFALFLLAAAELPHRKHPLFWLPFVAALWANLHGSLPMGLVVLLIQAVAVTVSGRSSTRSSVLVMWTALVLAALAGCLNPHGPALYAQILGFGQHAALATISEWRPLALFSLTGILFIVSLGLVAATMRYSPRHWPLADILLLAIFGLALLPAIRMQAWWALVLPYVLWPHAAAALRHRHASWWGAENGALDQPTAMRSLIAVGFVFMTLVVAPPSFSFIAGRARGEGIILSADTPLYVAEEAVRRKLGGSIAAPLDWADYLTMKTEGELKPLVHTHVHLADQEAWQAYETVFRGDADWLSTLQARKIRFLVVPRARAQNLAKQVLTEDRSGKGSLRIIYQDQRCLLAELL